MAGFLTGVLVGWLLGAGAGSGVELRELWRPGDTTRVRIELKAEGKYRPGPPPGGERPKTEAKDLALKVETRLVFVERVIEADGEGRARRSGRRVVQAASAINGEIRPLAATIRPEVMTLVAEARDPGVHAFSPGGPLTREELELVQGPGDPLALGGLLPRRPVAPGESWKVADEAARSLSGYDALAVNGLEATLEAVDADSARIKLGGTVRGAALGGEGSLSFDGSLRFDRRSGRIARLEIRRAEVRRAGQVEAGLDVKSTLSVAIEPAEAPPELSDRALEKLPRGGDRALERLLYVAPDGKYTLKHDRDWHLYWDDARRTVLKRLDRGELVAQCNLSVGPSAGRGRHQDLGQFRDDLRRALGTRFSQILGAGEVGGAPAGGFRYKVGVRGREAEVGVLWYYYLVASPDGDQLLVTFTLGEAQAKAFGDGDEVLIGSLEWAGRRGPAAGP